MKGHVAAQLARDAAVNQDALFKSLSAMMCWDAVVEVQSKAGIPKSGKSISGSNCAHVISTNDSAIANQVEMQKVPQGAFIGFFRDGSLVHAMLGTGAGIAAGNKNECIGIGNPVGWELLNLAEKLTWKDGGFRDPGDRLFLVRYREAK